MSKELAPILTGLTSVIAERNLILPVDGKRRRIRIEIGQPVQDVETAGGLDWRCPVRISGRALRRDVQGFGIDSLQALIHALKLVETEIGAIEKATAESFQWLGEPWHGIPKIRLAVPKLKKRKT